jgi:hypothetical protein
MSRGAVNMNPDLNPKRSPRGALTCLAMFTLGGAVLWGLFLAPRAASPPSPALPWGAPARTLRFVTFDCGGASAERLRDTADSIRGREPDFVLLQQVAATDVVSLVEALGLQKSHYTQLFQRTGPGGRDETGCLVLSKHPLYDARPVSPDGRRGRCLGTWAVAVIDGVRFAVVSGRADGKEGREAVARAWRALGSPPAVLGITPPGGSPVPGGWTAAGDAGLLVAGPGWHVVDAGTSSGPAGGAAAVDLSGAPAPRAGVTAGAASRVLQRP